MEYPVGPWVGERFGERAVQVGAGLAGALRQALADAQDAHREGKSAKLFTFGTTQATRRYECIVEALQGMDGVQIVKPKGFPHELAVLDGNLIYPFRYAKKDGEPIQRAKVTDQGKISRLIRELFKHYGPEPQQQTLFDSDEAAGQDAQEADALPVLTQLPDGTRLVLLGYASNERSGLLNAWIGEGELGMLGRVHWHRVEQLPLAPAGGGAGENHGPVAPLGPVPKPRLNGPAGAATAAGRFDDGMMPAVPLTARAPVERENSEQFPPVMEPAPQKTKADDQDQ